jgi:hypothetical protein
MTETSSALCTDHRCRIVDSALRTTSGFDVRAIAYVARMATPRWKVTCWRCLR